MTDSTRKGFLFWRKRKREQHDGSFSYGVKQNNPLSIRSGEDNLFHNDAHHHVEIFFDEHSSVLPRQLDDSGGKVYPPQKRKRLRIGIIICLVSLFVGSTFYFVLLKLPVTDRHQSIRLDPTLPLLSPPAGVPTVDPTSPLPSPTPTAPLRGHIVYVTSDDGVLYALDAQSGQMLASYSTGSPLHVSPSLANGIVYAKAADGYIYALNLQTRSFTRCFQDYGVGGSTPAISQGLLYIGSTDHSFYAIDTATCQQRWRFRIPTGSDANASPVVADGLVFIGATTVYTLDAGSGQLRWQLTSTVTPQALDAPLTVVDGVLYFGAFDSYVYAVRPSDGGIL
jgi:hypothetical protein